MSKKQAFIICLLILPASLSAYASSYFSGAREEKIDLLSSPTEAARWHGLDAIYRTQGEQERSVWKRVDGGESCPLNPGEALLFQVPGLSLVRFCISGALGADILKSIDIYQVSGLTDLSPAFPADTAAVSYTRVKVFPTIDGGGIIYVRAPIGNVITYEITHRLDASLEIRCQKMMYVPAGFLWESIEMMAVQKLSDKADEFVERLTSLKASNIELSFIEGQLAALPWSPQAGMIPAERQYRLARFFCDILYARRRDSGAFEEEPVEFPASGETHRGEVWHEVKPSSGITFSIEGPKLLKIETRYIYPDGAAHEVQRYKLSCYEDGLLKEVIYKSTVLDEAMLDNDGRSVGRVRTGYLVASPGRHEYRLVSDDRLLVSIWKCRKRLHMLDSLTGMENSSNWVEKSLLSIEKGLKIDPDSLRLLYLRASCYHLINRHEAALSAYQDLAGKMGELYARGEFLTLAGIHLHLAQLYAEQEQYPGAFDSLSSALRWCDEAIAQGNFLAGMMTRRVYSERARLLRRADRHLEAAVEYDLILQQAPGDLETRLLRAEALAWVSDLAALGEYDRTLQLDPGNAPAADARMRFWWDHTYWREILPSYKREGESLLELDLARDAQDREADGSVATGRRRFSGLCEIAPNIPVNVKTDSSEQMQELRGICYSSEEAPWLLEVDIDGGTRVQTPISQGRNEFGLPVLPGTHRIQFIAPQPSRSRILLDAGLSGVNRWYERAYFPLPEGYDRQQDSLVYRIDAPADTYIRCLAHIRDEKLERNAVTLKISIDSSMYTEVILENNARPSASEIQPHEFILPIPAGYHEVRVWRKHGAAGAILNLACRESREAKTAGITLAPGRKEPLPAYAFPPDEFPLETNDAVTAYRKGCELLASIPEDTPDSRSQFLDAIGLFTKAIHLAEVSDAVRYRAYLGRARALQRLGEFTLALLDCEKALDAPPVHRILIARARTQLADIHLDMGGRQNRLRALDEYIQLLEDGVDDIHIRLNLGRIYQMENEFEAAKEQYSTIIEAHPDHPEALFRRGAVEFQESSLAAAGDTLDYLLKIEKDRDLTQRAIYLRGRTAFLMGDIAAARRYFRLLRSEDNASTELLRTQAEWELARIAEVESILASSRKALTPADYTDLYYRIGRFNAGWVDSPGVTMTEESSELYSGNWVYSGNRSIIDYTAKTRCIMRDSGMDLGDHFLVSHEYPLILRMEGATLLRLDVRPAHPFPGTKEGADTRVNIEVQIEEDGVVKHTESIRGNRPSTQTAYPELTSATPGNREQIVYRTGSGVHRLRIRTSSGVAHVRPYVLHPGGTGFIAEQNGSLYIERSGDGYADWYARALIESLKLPDDAENLCRKARCLLALNMDRENALRMLHQAAREGNAGEAEYELGMAYMSSGEYEQAIDHFNRVSGTGTIQRNSRLYRLQAAARSARSFQEFELVAKGYDDYCAIYPDDADAKLDFAYLCRSLGDRAPGVSPGTYWYNRAINIYMSIMQSLPESREAEEGLEAARRKTRWQRMRVVQNSAGYRDVISEETRVSGFPLRLGAAMASPSWEADTYSLMGAVESAFFSLYLSNPVGVAVQLLGQMPANPEGSETGYSVEYLQDGASKGMFSAEPGEVVLRELDQLPAGQHLLQFRLAEPGGEEIIMARLLIDRELRSDYRARRYGNWYIVLPNVVRNYFLATDKIPVKTWIRGPTQLRLITQHFPDKTCIPGKVSFVAQIKGNNNASADYPIVAPGEVIIPVPDGLHEVIIAPDEENMTIGIRIYTSVYVKTEDTPVEGVTVHVSDITERNPDPLPVCWQEAPPSGSIPSLQKYGSVEMSLGYGSDFESEMTEGSFSNYGELMTRHRYRFEPAELYHRGALAVQVHDIGSVYTAEEFIYCRTPFDMALQSRLLGSLQDVNGSAEAAVEWLAELTRNINIASDLICIPHVGYAYRRQSLNGVKDAGKLPVSENVYSTYYKNHDRQIFLEGTLWYTPFLNLIAYGKGRVKTNREMNPFHPDYCYYRWGFRKLWRSKLESHFYHEARRWLADENRTQGRWDNRLYMELQYEWWRNDVRFTWQIASRYSIEDRENFLYISFGSGLNTNRMLRDYYPGEIYFRPERSRNSQYEEKDK